MKLHTKLIITGVCAYAVFVIATAPASLIFKFARSQIQAGAVSGTVWHGKATTLQAGIINLGDAEWNLNVLPLFIGRLGADIKLVQPKGFAQGHVNVSMGGKINLKNVSASLPFDSILGSGGLPGGWTGTAQIKLDELALVKNWPSAIKGTVDAIDVTGPANAPANLGNYRITFPSAESSTSSLVGDLRDLEGAAISVSGKLILNSDRGYQLDTMVATRPNTPESITEGIQFLG
ncbi:MAG TPA: type II secretion system protein N, partial [Steroidobacteraceae bacterium]|nr:type II secretion system protein N [Steroidobacteraceae bacterium]